jgi:hypothetical protein
VSLITSEKVRRNTRAFDLGAQCKRGGMSKERMRQFYAHERGHPDYNPEEMEKGWDWQDRSYRTIR